MHLKLIPAWRLVWCRDPRTTELLSDPDFIRINKYTLTRLSRCSLEEGVDLRPFKALRSLHCELVSPRGVASVRFPSSITSLELEVPRRLNIQALPFGEILEEENVGEVRRFNASCLTALTALKDLALTGWNQHDLLDLSPTVTSIRILNPKLPDLAITEPDAIDANLIRFPLALMSEKAKAALLAQRALRDLEGTSDLLHPSAAVAELRREAGEAPDWRSDLEESDEEQESYMYDVMRKESVDGEAMEGLEGAGAAPGVNNPPNNAAPGFGHGIIDLIAADLADIEDGEPFPAPLRRNRRRRRRNPHNDNGLDEDAAFAFGLAGHDDDMYDDGLGVMDDVINPELLDIVEQVRATRKNTGTTDTGTEEGTADGTGAGTSRQEGATATRSGSGGTAQGEESGGGSSSSSHEDHACHQNGQRGGHTHTSSSPHKCDDPNCIIHSGKHHLQLTFSDERQDVPIDLRYIIESKIPMISLTLDPTVEAAQSGVYMHLNVGESWEEFIDILRNSSVDVLEINHHLNGVVFTSMFTEQPHHYLWEGLLLLEQSLKDVFEFRTWDGSISRPGLVENGLCYALVRKKKEREVEK